VITRTVHLVSKTDETQVAWTVEATTVAQCYFQAGQKHGHGYEMDMPIDMQLPVRRWCAAIYDHLADRTFVMPRDARWEIEAAFKLGQIFQNDYTVLSTWEESKGPKGLYVGAKGECD
jgi:hypothetical protein